MQTKSGQVMEFGNTADSRIEAQGKDTVRLWAVNRMEDTVGNGIDFEYHEDNGNGEDYPTRIEYVGGVVEFGYEERPDAIVVYQAGGAIAQTQRLSSVTLYSNGAETSIYNFRYGDFIKSKLVRVACGSVLWRARPAMVL